VSGSPDVAGARPGNPEARRIADEALGVFVDVFGPLAADRFGAAYGPAWREDRGFRSDGVGARVHAISDPQELLGRLQARPEFDRVFRPALRIVLGTGHPDVAVTDGRRVAYIQCKMEDRLKASQIGFSSGGIAMTADQLRALIPVGWRAAIDSTLAETEFEKLAWHLSDEQRGHVPSSLPS
jgi:hypothetical protein